MSWLGLDIGGANLKAADGRGWARAVPFELWRNPADLAGAVTALLRSAPVAERLAVTMTGELCDCFRTKADGVRQIVSAVEQAADGREVRIYFVDGRLVSMAEAREMPQLAAASNWHALAQYVCRFVTGRAGLLIDVGSTTTDTIPLVDGRPWSQGYNDTDRLIAGELAYSGVGRTPVCAITKWLPWRGACCPVAAEVFATAADAYVLLDQIPEREDPAWTADGRPLTKRFALERLARMVCADSSTFDACDAELSAACVRDAQVLQLGRAIEKVIGQMACQPTSLVLSGCGEFLARRLGQELCPSAAAISLAERLGPSLSESAPAHALAVLANEADAALSGIARNC